jgi:hypothetical protein
MAYLRTYAFFILFQKEDNDFTKNSTMIDYVYKITYEYTQPKQYVNI